MAVAKTTAKKVVTKKVVETPVKPIEKVEVKPTETPELEPVEVKETNLEKLARINLANTDILKISMYKNKLIKNLKYQLKDEVGFNKTLKEIEVEDKKIIELLK